MCLNKIAVQCVLLIHCQKVKKKNKTHTDYPEDESSHLGSVCMFGQVHILNYVDVECNPVSLH